MLYTNKIGPGTVLSGPEGRLDKVPHLVPGTTAGPEPFNPREEGAARVVTAVLSP